MGKTGSLEIGTGQGRETIEAEELRAKWGCEAAGYTKGSRVVQSLEPGYGGAIIDEANRRGAIKVVF